ncbi:MAG: transketolase [Bacillota bacterium]|nr:transketolase [Bacillota bacterium]
MPNIKELQAKAIAVRKELLQTIYIGGTGHTGGALSSTDLLVGLFYYKMKHDPKNPLWDERDRFLLSKGHSVEGYYTILADCGYFPKEELKTFSKFKSRLIGHPSTKVPGVEMNTGSLGHGLPVGVGMAIAFKMDNKDNKVYVLMGDGEQAEGSIWEAAMAASNYKLDNIVGIVDRNHLQISGNTEDVMKLEDFSAKWTAFGWDVQQINGNNMDEIIKAYDSVCTKNGKPHLIIANTIKGKGVSFMENVAKWHHGVPTEEQLKVALEELDCQLKELM